MTSITATPNPGIDYELITDTILQSALMQTTIAKPNSTIAVVHHYENAGYHDPVVALLLTLKVRTLPRIRYVSTLFGTHTFLAT
jgi:hypothetical protein